MEVDKRTPIHEAVSYYDKYFIKGEEFSSNLKDYTSHNTKRLSVEEIINLLLSLDYIKEHING